MAAETATADSTSYSSLKRVYDIPLVNDSISTLHGTLQHYTLTRSPYNMGLAVGEKAYNLSQPIQTRLAPVLVRADGFANKGLDAVESRYPYPFQTPTQDVYKDLKAIPDHAVEVANKAAQDIASDLDQRLTPLVNRYESVLARIGARSTNDTSSATSDTASEGSVSVSNTAESQVERAYKLSLEMRNQIYTVSSEHLKHLQTSVPVVQRITEAVYNVNTQVAASYSHARSASASVAQGTQSRVHTLSTSIITELQKIQSTTASLPAHVQATLAPIQEHLKITIASLTDIVKSDKTVSDKAADIKTAVQKEVHPLLEATLDQVHAYVQGGRKYMGLKAEEAKEAADEVTSTNGNAH